MCMCERACVCMKDSVSTFVWKLKSMFIWFVQVGVNPGVNLSLPHFSTSAHSASFRAISCGPLLIDVLPLIPESHLVAGQ